MKSHANSQTLNKFLLNLNFIKINVKANKTKKKQVFKKIRIVIVYCDSG